MRGFVITKSFIGREAGMRIEPEIYLMACGIDFDIEFD